MLQLILLAEKGVIEIKGPQIGKANWQLMRCMLVVRAILQQKFKPTTESVIHYVTASVFTA